MSQADSEAILAELNDFQQNPEKYGVVRAKSPIVDEFDQRRALEIVEELKDKDIVYLNITSFTSPFEDWKRQVKNIPGEHYYLSNEQFDALHTLYKSLGSVPSYAIYNPQGELVQKQLGFGGVDPLKSALLKALE